MNSMKSKSQIASELFCRIISPYRSKRQVEDCLNILLADDELLDLCIALANKRYMVATFFTVIKTHELDGLLSPALHEYMSEMTQFMQQRGAALTALTEEIIRSSNQHGIAPLLLKGSGTLFSKVYPEKGIRFMSDLDILFKTDHVMTIFRQLQAQGFAISKKHSLDIDLPTYIEHPVSANIPVHEQHLLPLYRDGAPCSVELHVRPLHRNYRHYLDADSAFRTSIPIEFESGSTLVARRLSPENEVIYCFVHSQIAHAYYQCHYLDVLQMDFFVRLVYRYENELDWDAIHSRIKQAGGEIIFQHYLFAVNQLFATNFPLAEIDLTELQMIKRYQSSLGSCFPQYHPMWKVRFFMADIMSMLSRERMQRLYKVDSAMSLLTARFQHVLIKLWKFRRPSAFAKRLKRAFRMF